MEVPFPFEMAADEVVAGPCPVFRTLEPSYPCGQGREEELSSVPASARVAPEKVMEDGGGYS